MAIDLLSAVPSGPLRRSAILWRANTSWCERPDRLSRAVLAAFPYGTGFLAAMAASAARYPRAAAVATSDQCVSYRGLWRGSGALAGALKRRGVGSADRVGILCRNSPTFVYALLAVAMVGADIVLLNTAMGGSQLADVIAAENVTAVLHDDDFGAVVSVIAGVHTVDATGMRAIVEDRPLERVEPPERDSRLVILTSGTTGRPKGASRSTASGAHGVASVLASIPFRLRDRTVVAAPFFHGWGLAALLTCLGLSGSVFTAPEFDAGEVLSLLSSHRAHGLVLVPTMLQRICALPPAQLARADTENLRVIASSGSALPGRLATEALDRFGQVLYNVYGSTEVAAATIARPADLRRDPATAGRPALGVRVEVLSEHGAPVPPGTVGRICVNGKARYDGYTGGADRDVVAGLISTGDLGYFDDRGRLFVVGREDDMIVSGGENVYPSEIEDLLNTDDRVGEAVVVGIDDDQFGQALKAVVVIAAGQQASAQELKELIANRLARFKVPRVFEFVDALPRNATGKVLRRQLV